MQDTSSLELLFVLDNDEELKTRLAVHHLVEVGRRMGGDYRIDGKINDDLYMSISIKISKEQLIHDGMVEK